MAKRNDIKLGTHGEDYGNWMSTPVFYVFGGLAALALILAVVSFALLHIAGLGVLFTVAAAVQAILLCRFYRIRRQYAFGGGNIMENVHNGILSHLRYNGRGTLLDVGCGSGALSIRAALIWPEAKVIGVDSWGAMYGYSKALCEKNAASEGVGFGVFLQDHALKRDLSRVFSAKKNLFIKKNKKTVFYKSGSTDFSCFIMLF